MAFETSSQLSGAAISQWGLVNNIQDQRQSTLLGPRTVRGNNIVVIVNYKACYRVRVLAQVCVLRRSKELDYRGPLREARNGVRGYAAFRLFRPVPAPQVKDLRHSMRRGCVPELYTVNSRDNSPGRIPCQRQRSATKNRCRLAAPYHWDGKRGNSDDVHRPTVETAHHV